ncbi:MAG: hypothetical protein KDJ36_00140 [Hyphomicrobiaceae bacterium]|nr:hypothetical protein [Hyphomicrobiaceae bacterium]
MSDYQWNQMRGESGDMSAPGWGGYLGYEKHRQRQERERIAKISADADAARSGGGGHDGSAKNLVMIVFVLIGFEAVLNLTGFLTSDWQRVGAFAFAVVAGTIVNLYWIVITRVLTAAVLFVGGVLLIEALWGK